MKRKKQRTTDEPIVRLQDFPEQPRLLEPGWLRSLGVYGYDAVEDVILAALVTEDPLLLIGKAGTGKTFLLNSLSEALGLEHRHYNASLIAFDDLVGFPFPEKDGSSIRYIETPATVWKAESVLIDELSRCKPEHQNRLFSLVHERRIQGLALPELRYRWAAMNPCEQGDDDDFYEGSVALDQALADRFAFVLEVPDWDGLEEVDRLRVADARGIGKDSVDAVGLRDAVLEGRRRFLEADARLHETVKQYTSKVASLLLQPQVRLSPRRVVLLSRNLVALTLVTGGRPDRDVFRNGLISSLPQLAWGKRVPESVLRGAHVEAWDHLTQNTDQRWLSKVINEPDLPRRCKALLIDPPSRDVATMAVRQSLAHLSKTDAAIFSLAMLPVGQSRPDLIGEESLAAIAEVAGPILEIEAEAKWRLRYDLEPENNPHPALSECSVCLESLSGARKERARQLFYHCVTNEYPLEDPAEVESLLEKCLHAVKPFIPRNAA